MPNTWIIDPWTPYDYKASFSRRTPPTFSGSSNWMAPRWVGDHWRRLQAYALLESYYRNASRQWLDQLDDEDQNNRREYGDAKTVVDQVLASLIGDTQAITVPDAEGENPIPEAIEQAEVLLNWARDERFIQKLIETERNAVKLGDACYVLGWRDGRPRLHSYDPGFYFPVFDPTELSEEFPKKIHIAYEYEAPRPGAANITEKFKYVRRITWEIVDVEDDRVEDNSPRNHEWNEEPVSITCLYTDATWLIDNLVNTVEDFVEEFANYAVRDEDLNIDFIPVVHIPNTISDQEHFGTSTLASVMQLFDDIIGTDTDLQAASATTGTPPIALSGAGAPKDEHGNIKSYGPGTVFETGDGTATMIDTSSSLDALLKYDEHLLGRLAVNSRVPESLLGRIKPNEVPSGIAITLSFTPHSSMIREMRLVRDDKYRLLFKFVTRFYISNGDLTEDLGAEMKFGSFLPADKSETSNLVSTLLKGENKCISLETAVRMLINAGYPIDDAVEEVARIRADDFQAANTLLDATGDIDAVRLRLGLGPAPEQPALPEGPPAPEQELP